MDSFGFLKVAAAVPHVRVGDCDFNAERMAAMAEEAAQRGVEIVAFPELALTAYTCGDLLLQPALLDAADVDLLLAAERRLFKGDVQAHAQVFAPARAAALGLPAAEAAALPPNERKRLALILLLMQRKRVLLLDEPFCGLDAESVFVVQQLILQLGCEGRTLLIAADSLALLDGICDDLYVLGGGQVQGRYEHYEFQRAIREAGSAAGFPKK